MHEEPRTRVRGLFRRASMSEEKEDGLLRARLFGRSGLRHSDQQNSNQRRSGLMKCEAKAATPTAKAAFPKKLCSRAGCFCAICVAAWPKASG